MFENCYKLKSLDVSKFNTKNVEYMDAMFHNCKSLTNLKIKGFKTSKAINGKAYKTVKSNAKGNFAVKTKKLKAGQKIKVTVSKSGYKTRTSGTIKVKKK